MKTWKAVIPYDLISPNRLMRMHFAQRGKEHVVVYNLLARHGEMPLVYFDGQVDVKIKRLYGYRKRAMDQDNLYGACKILLDVLREPSPRSKKSTLGLISDDSPNVIRNLSVTQEKSPDKETWIVVEVSEWKPQTGTS